MLAKPPQGTCLRRPPRFLHPLLSASVLARSPTKLAEQRRRAVAHGLQTSGTHVSHARHTRASRLFAWRHTAAEARARGWNVLPQRRAAPELVAGAGPGAPVPAMEKAMENGGRAARIENSAATAPLADDAAGGGVAGATGGGGGGGGSGAAGASAQAPAAPAESISYSADRVIGNGSFGVVFQATVRETGETVAIKKVLQDKRYKNRELQIMRMLDHTNIVKLKHCFYSSGEKQDEVYLNLVLEYIPETVYRISRHYSKVTASIPAIFIKLYVYQLLRALAYIHSSNVTHRDIKPQNLLLDPASQVLKLCDFGSAKILVPNEPNISYICSRYYRAPELIFGATDYLPAIDIWSTGCVMAELMLGQPLFPGESGVDQLVEIIKVLGTPSKDEIMAMNRNYTEFKFPQIKPHPWHKVFRVRTTPDAIDLVSKMLQYSPTKRLRPMEGLTHEYFDELRSPTCRLPNGKSLPPLFDFSKHEFKVAGHLAERILPPDIFEDLCSQHGRPPPAPRGTSSAPGDAGSASGAPPAGNAADAEANASADKQVASASAGADVAGSSAAPVAPQNARAGADQTKKQMPMETSADTTAAPVAGAGQEPAAGPD